jgi:hypothetical protein
MKKLKDFKQFTNEGNSPEVAPARPITKPLTRPGKPSPIPTHRPSVIPKPKASAEDLAKKFLRLSKGKKTIMDFLKNKYENK